MSNLFEVLKKENALDLTDVGEAPVLAAAFENGRSVPPPPPPEPVVSGTPMCRVARLRVSGLAPLFPFEEAHHAAAEQYRIIRTKVLHSEKKPRLLLVSSACSGDGKTVTSINLAASLALKQDTSVLLVDADLRRPRISRELGIPAAPGLSELISGRTTFDGALVRAEQFPNLSILPAGETRENPAEMFDSDRWRGLIEEMRSRFDIVICDSSPVATVADYDLLQLVCDSIILVIRPDRTNRRAYAKVLEMVPKDKLLGIVLNGVEDWLFWKTPVYEYYSKAHEQATE